MEDELSRKAEAAEPEPGEPGEPGRGGQAVSTRRAQAASSSLGKWIGKTLDVVDTLADAAGDALRLPRGRVP